MSERIVGAVLCLWLLCMCNEKNVPVAASQILPVLQPENAGVKVDGFASASGRHFLFDSALVYASRAQVYWRDDFNNGDEHYLKWGTDSLRFGDSVTLLPFTPKKHIMTEIGPLLPGEKYFALFHRPYKRDIANNLRFSFTTPDTLSSLASAGR